MCVKGRGLKRTSGEAHGGSSGRFVDLRLNAKFQLGQEFAGAFAKVSKSISDRFLARVRAFLGADRGRMMTSNKVSAAVSIADDRRFDMRSPSSRNSTDLFYGEWLSSLPTMQFPADYSANMAFYNDIRIHRFHKKIGGFGGKRVLELGPMEAGHSYLMGKFGAADILAIEAGTAAFLKCLIVKEILGINARFLLGDFNKYLKESTQRFDVVLACGILYHQTEPLELIEGMAKAADCICVWTHYYEDSLRSDPVRARAFGSRPIRREFHRQNIDLYEHCYFDARRRPNFNGGGHSNSFWLTREGIVRVFQALGFVVEVIDVEANNPNGPAMTFVAQRLPAVEGAA